MANTSIGQMNVGINFDTSSFEQGLKNIQKNMNVLDSQMRVAKSSISNFGNATDSLKTKADSLSQKIDLQKQKVQALKNAYDESVAKKGQDATATQNLEIRLNNATTSLNKMQAELKATRQELANMPNAFDKIGTAVDNFNSKLSEFGSKIESFGTKMTAGITAPLIALATAGVKYNAQMETYMSRLTTLLGSESKAQSVLSQIKKDAASTPYNVDGLTQANSLLISAGLSAEDSRKTILALGDAVSASGGGDEELARMAVNLQQIKNTGKATALDIKQFAFAGIDIYGMLAEYTGKTKEQVKDMDITWDMLNNSIIKASSEGGKYFGAMEKQSETLNGKFSSLKDSFSMFSGNLTNSLTPTLNKIMDNVSKVLDKFNALDSKTQASTLKFLGFAAAIGPANIVLGKLTPIIAPIGTNITKLADNIDKLSSKGLNFSKSFGTNVTNAFNKSKTAIDNFANKNNTISKTFNKIITSAGSFNTNFANKIKSIANLQIKIPFADKIAGKIKGLEPTINTAFSKIGSTAQKATSKLQSIANLALKLVGPVALIGVVLTGLGVVQQQFGPQIDKFAQIAITKGPTIIQNLVNGITSKLPDLINAGSDLLVKFLDVITANLPTIINGGIQILTSLIDGVVNNIDKIIPAVITVITTLLTSLIDNLPKILDAGLKILMALVDGIVNNIDKIIDGIIQVMLSLINTIPQFLPQLIEAGIKILVALIEGLSRAIPQLIGYLPEIISAILNAFKNTDWSEIGKNIINGLVDGLKSLGGSVVNTLKSIGSDALKGFKKMFGIHSPSTVFAGFGKYMMQGLNNGLEDNKDKFVNSLNGLKSITDNTLGNLSYEVNGTASNSKLGQSLIANNHTINNSTSTVNKPIINIYTNRKIDDNEINNIANFINKKYGYAL